LQQFNSQNQTVNLKNVGAIPAAPTKQSRELIAGNRGSSRHLSKR